MKRILYFSALHEAELPHCRKRQMLPSGQDLPTTSAMLVLQKKKGLGAL